MNKIQSQDNRMNKIQSQDNRMNKIQSRAESECIFYRRVSTSYFISSPYYDTPSLF